MRLHTIQTVTLDKDGGPKNLLCAFGTSEPSVKSKDELHTDHETTRDH